MLSWSMSWRWFLPLWPVLRAVVMRRQLLSLRGSGAPSMVTLCDRPSVRSFVYVWANTCRRARA